MPLLSGALWRRQGVILLLSGVVGIAGCAVHSFATYHDFFGSGDLVKAEEKLENIPQPNKNEVLIKMHYATLRQLEGNFEESNRLLEEVKRLSEQLAPLSISESSAALLVNDAVRSYSGSIFERVMVFVNKYINYVALGQYNEARIEMRQAELQLREWNLEPQDYPYLPLLLALAYEGLGRTDDALVAYRRALLAYGNTAAPKLLKQSYLNLLASARRTTELAEQERRLGMSAERNLPAASLVVIGTAGQVGRRLTHSIYHAHPTTFQDFLISIPVYPDKPHVPRPPLVRLKDAEANTEADAEVSFELLTDLEQGMRDALAEDLPILILRALARALIQDELQAEADRQDNALLSFAVLAGRITSSSVTDTRSWDSLPSALYISRLSLSPGPHTSFVSTDVYATPVKELNIERGMNFYPVLTR